MEIRLDCKKRELRPQQNSKTFPSGQHKYLGVPNFD